MATPVLVNGVSGVTGTAANVRAMSCDVEQFAIYNPNTGAVFVQLFDMPSGAQLPTLGSTVPKYSFGVGPTGALHSSFTVSGLRFEGGLWVAATTTVGGATGPTTAVVVNLALT